jgi:hypothetical protein
MWGALKCFLALKWQQAKRVLFGSKKVEIFRTPLPSNGPSNVFFLFFILYSVFSILYYVF